MTGVAPLITAQRITALHARCAEAGNLGGDSQRPGCVDGAIGAALTAAMYEQDANAPDPLLVAAYLLRSLCQNHCFVDGNKRVAWLAALEVLAAGAHLTIAADQVEAAVFVIAVAEGHIQSAAEITAWLANRLVSL